MYKQGKIYHGFEVIKSYMVNEIDSYVYEFSHVKSGAKLLYIKNEDENKVFSITFRTPSLDNSGTAHILEHSVLCGSKKYPLKEPFVDLMKSSLNTFLNAMTFSDKTMYPVASLNEADFSNLMDVYLDAVFNPLIYDKKEILMQEGWHYHLEDKSDDIIYNGVVYNEMKGAFSRPEDILFRNVEASLYPDTSYFYESGGDPKYIPELTYEKFLDFHKLYYHPSNSYIYLYGDMDIDKHMEHLDKEYLDKYEKITTKSKVEKQKAFLEEKKVELKYNVDTTENINSKYLLAYNFSISDSLDKKTAIAFNILGKILFDSDASILKKALIEKNIADEVNLDYSVDILQPVLVFSAKNAKKDKIDDFKNTIIKTLEDLVLNGIAKEDIKCAINNLEFELKEGDSGGYPKGLLYCITIMESWLYDGHPTLHLEYKEALDDIKNNIGNGYLEEVIKKYILDNTHSSFIKLTPSLNENKSYNEKLKKELKEYKESLNEKEVNDLVEKTNDLIKAQQTPDSKETKDLIPTVKVEDIKKTPDLYLDTKEISLGENKIYLREDTTKGITYLDINFEITLKNAFEISSANFLTKIFKNLDTKEYSPLQINNNINLNLGDLGFFILSCQSMEEMDKFRVFFTAYSKAFIENEKIMYDYIIEIIKNTIFEDKNKIKEIIKEEISKMESKIMGASHRMAISKLMCTYSQSARFRDYLNGFGYLDFLKELDINFSENYEKLICTLSNFVDMILSSRKDVVITTDKKNADNSTNLAKEFLSNYPLSKKASIDFEYNNNTKNTAYIIPSEVNYVAYGYSYKKLGFEYNSSVLVLKKYLATEYLWNKVRVIGGAYGAFLNVDKFGNLCFASYRDPNIEKTIEVYKQTPKVIKDFSLSKDDIDKLIIGTIGEIDSPSPVYSKVKVYVIRKYKDDTKEGIELRRNQILNTTKEDILNLFDMFDVVIKNANTCVIGSDKIKTTENIFDFVSNVF